MVFGGYVSCVRSYIVYFPLPNELKHLLQALGLIFTGAIRFSAYKVSVGVKFGSADGPLYSACRRRRDDSSTKGVFGRRHVCGSKSICPEMRNSGFRGFL